jgi:hypothetical protein
MVTRETLGMKLASSSIRIALQRAGMFLTGWELLKSDIEDGVRQFFEVQPGVVDPDYERNVLSRHKYKLHASALWLVEQGALTATQCDRIEELRRHRNEIAHELAKLLIDPNHEINVNLLEEMATILRAVGAFFGRIAVDCDPESDGKEIDDKEIRSGTSLLMDHLVTACDEIAA